jgi:hypothetical protein
MKRRLNLRLAVGVTVVLGLAAFGIASAMADVSPTPVNPGDTTLYWSGQGDPVQQQCGASADDGGFGSWVNGSSPTNYLVWIFSTDGGSVSATPTLTVNNTVYTNPVFISNRTDGSTWHFLTPFIDPSTIAPANKQDQSSTGGAFTSFPPVAAANVGTGNWKLVISHGCGGHTIPPAADLTASKNAIPSFTRTYTWGISKSADKTTVLSAGGGESGPVNYTVSVTHNGGTDSGWTVSGDITVTNPNAAGDNVTGVNVTDAINDANATCTVTGGSNATIPGASSIDFPYTCTYSQAPGASSQTNTATITWPAQTLADTSVLAANSATGTAGIDWSSVDPTIVDGSVTVTDTLGGSLGTVSYTDPSPKVFTYPLTFKDPAGTCTKHKNTATFTTSDTKTTGSDSATVSDCQGADLTVSKDATPAFTRTYTWGISKSADPTKVFTAGGADGKSTYTVNVTHDNGTDSAWTVTGTITVTNPNDWESVTLTGVSDAIDNGGNCSITSGDVNGTIAAGDSATFGYSCSYASAPNPAAFTNTATATWDKTAASTPDGSADGTATGAFGDPTTIVDGSVDVTDSVAGDLGTVSYTDPSPKTFTYDGAVSGPAGTCTPNKNTATFTTSDTQTTGSDSATVTDCQGADLTVKKDATPAFTRTYTWGISKSADPTRVFTAGGADGKSTYTVNVTHDNGTDSGWTVTGTITVSNPNDWESVTLTGVSDAIDNGGNCSITSGDVNGTIPAGDSATFGYSCSYASAPNPAAFTNKATATWDASAASTPDGSADGTAKGAFGDPTTIVDGSVTVTDSVAGPLGTVSYTDPSPRTFTYNGAVSGPAGTCTPNKNTATFTTSDTQTTGSDSATVTDCQGADLTVKKDATPAFTRKYTWNINKGANPTKVYTAGGADGTSHYTVTVLHDGGTDSGWTVTGTITVSNPNDWESVTLTGVSDAIDNGGNCSITSGDVNGTIAAGDSATFGYSCSYASAPTAAAFKNTATATWDKDAAHTSDGSADGTAKGAFGDPTTIVDGSVTVTDSVAGPLGTVSLTDPNPTTFTYDHSVSGPAGTCTDTRNTATFITSDTQTTGSDSATVTDCQGADLTVTKTATGSFTRDYDWSVVKKQTTSSTPINSSASSVTVAYKVTAAWTGPYDGGWKVTGTITVHNPNDWESITLTGVTDAIDNGGTCVVSGNTGQTIAANSDSTGLTYTCTYASAPSPAAGTNTATATWDKTAASTPHGSASGSKGVDFSTVTPTVTHDTTTVTDAFNGGGALTLGVANINGTFVKAVGNTLANWTSGYAPNTFTFTYTRSVPVVASMCKEYDNTATVSPDRNTGNNSSNASVTVCGLVTGGLTIGYWSNNNGQTQECNNDPKWRQLLDGTWTTAPYTGGSYLRNGNGTYYTVPTTGTCANAHTNFNAWLLGANSSNASYMLSAQLAGTILNVNLNGMNGNACIVGTSGPITINNLISNVITFLRNNPNTTAAGAARTLAVNYQTLLNNLNNGLVYATTGC